MPSNRERRNILLLTHRVPDPPDRGDRIRSHHLLRHLAAEHDVSLACVCDEPLHLSQFRTLRTVARSFAICPISPVIGKVRAAKALLTGQSLTHAYHHQRQLARQIYAWHNQRPFDAVVTFCSGMARYAKLLASHPAPPTRQVLDLVDVDSAKWARYAQQSGPIMRRVYAAESRRIGRVERDPARLFDAVTVISEQERERYIDHPQPAAMHDPVVVPNGVDTQYFQPQPQPKGVPPTVLFVGVLDYAPNIEAVTWFADNVWPGVRRDLPDAQFAIVGKRPTSAVTTLGRRAGVQVVGPVDDVRPYIARSSVVVAPLQLAMGVQNKVLEAMASGRPVVATQQAATGIDAVPGRDLVIADEPADFACQVQRLLIHPSQCALIGTQARLLVQQRYDWAACLRPMLDLLDLSRDIPVASHLAA